uniref:Putative ovule protein n=1 Tax=Solanum chacoense TaxID=4108 RepID=A0A0V0H162_SOLCH
MEGFSSMMRITIHNNWLKGFRIGEGGLEICHLLYVDDTIIFCEATVEQVTYVRVILVIFGDVSGLKVEWRKSSIFPIKRQRMFSPWLVCWGVKWACCLLCIWVCH